MRVAHAVFALLMLAGCASGSRTPPDAASVPDGTTVTDVVSADVPDVTAAADVATPADLATPPDALAPTDALLDAGAPADVPPEGPDAVAPDDALPDLVPTTPDAAPDACTGAGCAPLAPACLFGARVEDLRADGAPLWLSGDDRIASGMPLLPFQIDQIRALLRVADIEVATADEAFARVDGSAFDRLELYDPDGARSFTVLQFRIDGRGYGAVFVQRTTIEAARILDGAFTRCVVSPARCALGGRYGDLFESGTVTIVDEEVLTKTSSFDELATAQLVRAVEEAYADVTDLASAFEAVDGGTVNRTELTQGELKTAFTAYEYGAGDNSYGAIFFAGTMRVAAEINDGDFYECRAFTVAAVGDGCSGDPTCVTGRCRGVPDGPGCVRRLCTAACAETDECVAYARVAGAAEPERARCVDGECALTEAGLGERVCD